MKHIDVLREAGLIKTLSEGRYRQNTTNVVPIRQMYDRWTSKYQDHWAGTLTGLKESVEQ